MQENDSAQTPVTSRRAFLKYGAGSVAAGVAGGSLVYLQSTAAGAQTNTVDLFINDGNVIMIDGAPVYMWRFSRRERDANGKLSVPCRPVVLHAVRGETVNIAVKNNLGESHSFVIKDMIDEGSTQPVTLDSGPIPPGHTWRTSFPAPRAGTYLYQDGLNAPVNRVLGLGGAFVVSHPGLRKGDFDRPFPGGPFYFREPFIWTLADVDPVWNELARAGRQNEINWKSFLPRYFNINGRSGFQSMEDETVKVARHIGQPSYIRVVNTGLATHALHWHGNHVFNWAHNNERFFESLTEDDVVHIDAEDRVEVLLPYHRANDAWPPARGSTRVNSYPMHCHAEMSQTAAGGLYPSGMVTDWELEPKA